MTEKNIASLKPAVSGRWWLFVILWCLALCVLSAQKIDGSSIKGDATQNLILAKGIYEHGEFSLGGGLTSFREPVPPLLVATYLQLFADRHSPMDLESMHYGAHTRFVKLSNLFWVFWGLLGSWLLFFEVSQRRWLSLAAPLLSAPFFFTNPLIVNSLYTELQAGTLMIWCSYLLIRAAQQPRAWRLLLTGVFLGLLCLTKALFLPVSFVVIAAMMIKPWPERPGSDWRAWKPKSRVGLYIGLGLGVTVLPWIGRNHAQMQSTEISAGRSGYILLKRAMIDQITDDEFKAGFYLFGPQPYKRLVAGTGLDVKADEAVKREGRLARLNGARSDFIADDTRAFYAGHPEQVISFYRRAAAVHVQLTRLFEQAHDAHPTLSADKVMQKVALQQFADHPWRHLKVSLLMFWRGFWCLSPGTPLPLVSDAHLRPTLVVGLNAAAGLALLFVFSKALLQRQTPLFFMTALPVLMMLVYTLVSQNLPRFFAPAVPFMMLSLFWLLAPSLCQRASRR